MLKARDYIPALKHGAKITPEDVAGMIGLPSVGEIFYVDPGKSSSGGGKSADDAFKTLAEAYAAMSADNDDVVIIAPTSATGRTSESASITWAKRRTHVIGNGPLRKGWNRAGISFASTATTPSLTISANNCSFTNFMIYQPNDINVMVNLTGEYNTFNYVHFAGIANATTGDDTAARCLTITEADDNQFNNCMFGIDTVLNSAANAIVELYGDTAVARTQFNDCIWSICCDNAGPVFVKFSGAYSSEVYTVFRDCLFLNTRGGTTTMTAGMTVPASVNGRIIIDNSWWLGCTDLPDANVANVYVNNPVVDAIDAGVLIVHANS
jgi:hypothetical protein